MLLIVDKRKEAAIGLSEMFFYMGIPSFAVDAGESLEEISEIYRGVIVLSPENFYDLDEFIYRLRRKGRDVPIFAMLDEKSSAKSEYKSIFDDIFSFEPYAAKIYKMIIGYTESHSFPSPGIYKANGINASVDLKFPTYLSSPLPFTKTETMILRSLIRAYPGAFSSKNILKYAFKNSRAPDLASIRTHISIMNKKFRKITGRNLITLSLGSGYRISEDNIYTCSEPYCKNP